MKVRTISMFLLFVLVISGCSAFTSIQEIISENYPLKDTVKSSSNPNDAARVYIAKGKSIDEIAKFLQKQKEPERISKQKNGKQVLVYEDYFVTLMVSDDNPDNTQIEVATYTFVRDNYRPSFFDGLMAYWILGNLFDVDDWAERQHRRCRASLNPCYGGYVNSGGRYKGPTKPPSFRGSLFRGGGPNAGK